MSDSVPDPSGLSFYLNGKGWGVHILGWMAPGLGGGLRGGGSLEIIAFIVDVIAALIVGRSGLPSITFQFLPRVALSGLRSGLLFGCIIAAPINVGKRMQASPSRSFVVAASLVGASRPVGLFGLIPRPQPSLRHRPSQYRWRLDL
ncbi:hypothetical protein Krac_5817 [Ktedonobacter racemifer DSM 44963]|uniref:Uncharacterized protein n=1 Tax=Ktedonobacter racemifer DSM 44963 TaxID=485913 RepID=D6TWY3_KTERA|nr:hypothetical protein Krac_5817 [Ktedonobacter racemifer DSM 44963]